MVNYSRTALRSPWYRPHGHTATAWSLWEEPSAASDGSAVPLRIKTPAASYGMSFRTVCTVDMLKVLETAVGEKAYC